ncbi:MAG: hemolysin family protein [Clostridia bacterium]
MEIPLYTIAIAILILLSGIFSATETAFSSLNKIRIRNMANNSAKKSRLVLKLNENYDSLISTILIGNNIVNIAASTLSTLLFAKLIVNDVGISSLVSTIVMTLIVLTFGEITPKTIAKRSPEFFAHALAPFVLVFYYLFFPLTYLFGLWQKLVSKIFKKRDDDNITDEELMTIVAEAQTEGGLNEYEGELIKSAIEFDDLTVVDTFTPRVDVEALDIEVSMTDALYNFRITGFSRLPVYKDNIDTIIGVLNEKDFYKAYLNGDKTFEKAVVDNVMYATPRMKISSLLRKLQKAKTHFAVVVDEFGGTMGIVTLEDILEELVGEIWDEHDEIVENFKQITDTKFSVSGDCNLEDFFDYFKVNKSDENYEPITLSGFILLELGRLANVGDIIKFENLTITVKKIVNHKIEFVEVTFDKKEDEDIKEN